MTKKSNPSWWEGAQRDDFSRQCMTHFNTTFDHAEFFVIKADYIRTKGSNTHFLHKQIAHGLEPLSAGRREATRQKHVASQMSVRAMQRTKQSSESLLGL